MVRQFISTRVTSSPLCNSLLSNTCVLARVNRGNCHLVWPFSQRALDSSPRSGVENHVEQAVLTFFEYAILLVEIQTCTQFHLSALVNTTPKNKISHRLKCLCVCAAFFCGGEHVSSLDFSAGFGLLDRGQSRCSAGSSNTGSRFQVTPILFYTDSIRCVSWEMNVVIVG